MINACPVIQCNFLYRVMHMKTIHGGMMWLECNFANQSSKHNLSTIVYSFYGVSNHWTRQWTGTVDGLWNGVWNFSKRFHRNIAYCLAIYSLTM